MAGESTTFPVNVKDNLPAGIYSAMVTVSADDVFPVAFTVMQVVSAASAYSISLEKLDPNTFRVTVDPPFGVSMLMLAFYDADDKLIMLESTPLQQGQALYDFLNVAGTVKAKAFLWHSFGSAKPVVISDTWQPQI